MKLKILHEGMGSLVTATFDLLKKRLEDEAHYVLGDMLHPGTMAYLRVINPFNPTTAVTITISDKIWPKVAIDAGVTGVGIVEKDMIDLSDDDAIDRIATFTAKHIQYGEETPEGARGSNPALFRMAAKWKHQRDKEEHERGRGR